MIVEVLSIGDEVLSGDITNTNTQYISEQCWAHGLQVEYHSGVRDDENKIREALLLAAKRSDVILCTGGLGPTADDFTIEVAASTFGTSLEIHDGALSALTEALRKRGREVSDSNRKQALIFKGGEAFINKMGTAPGSYYKFQDKHFYFMPGVPREMKYLLSEHILPHILQRRPEKTVYKSVFLKTFGSTESELDKALKDLLKDRVNIGSVRVGYRFSFPEVFIKLSSWDENEAVAQKNLDHVLTQVRERIGRYIYTDQPQDTLESLVIQELTKAKKTVAVAESCTGGLVSHRLTNTNGSGEVFLGGIVSYDKAVKAQILGVPQDILDRHGAVSEECAVAMVRGVRQALKADYCAAITGLAGPTSGDENKPVGTVFIATLCDEDLACKEYHFQYPRDLFKEICASVVFKRFLDYGRKQS